MTIWILVAALTLPHGTIIGKDQADIYIEAYRDQATCLANANEMNTVEHEYQWKCIRSTLK
jgi:hypothetical protein